MRRPVMSFGAYAAGFDGTDEEARMAYEDHMKDVRSGKADLEVSPAPPRVDWDAVRRECEAIRRAALAYIRALDPWRAA